MNTNVTKPVGNIGKIDAVIRGVFALILIGIVLSLELGPVTRFALVVLSIPTMLFALTRWDPIYSLFGFSTGKDKLRA